MTARSPTMVTLRDTRFVECRWWNDGWTVEDCCHLTVVGLHDTGPWLGAILAPFRHHRIDTIHPGHGTVPTTSTLAGLLRLVSCYRTCILKRTILCRGYYYYNYVCYDFYFFLLLRTLDGDARDSNESCCPPLSLRVTKELVTQRGVRWSCFSPDNITTSTNTTAAAASATTAHGCLY